MKNLFLSLALIAVTATAFAQQPGKKPARHEQKTPEQRATNYAEHLSKDLGLTEEQKTKVKSLSLTKQEKLTKLREQYKGQPDSVWSTQRKQVREEFNTGMKSVLTADQFAQWQTKKKEQRAHHGKHPPMRTPEERATGFADRLEKDLGLDAGQKKKVHDLALTKEQKLDELREANKGKEPSTWADQRKKVMDEFNDGMKTTLSPEQFQKWEEQKKAMREQRKGHPQQKGKAEPEQNPAPDQKEDK
jgi:periplasmic protein CpxP/Spy